MDHAVLLDLDQATSLMTDPLRRTHLYHLLAQTLAYQVPGDVVELGCYIGETSRFIRKVLDEHDSAKEFHVYDSFQGLPPLTEKDYEENWIVRQWHGGELAVSSEVLRLGFFEAGLKPPCIHEGFFCDTLACGLPDQISFAFLDGDLYESIRDSLIHVYPRLSPGAVCVIDDYSFMQFPGCRRACDEFFADRPEQVSHLWRSKQGYFRKLPEKSPKPRAIGRAGVRGSRAVVAR